MTRVKGDPEHVDSRGGAIAMSGGMAIGGGGRRKQSKPNRVYMDVDATMATAAPMDEQLAEPPHAGTPQMDVDSATDMSLPPAFMDHDDSQMSGDDNANTTAFPTKYHQLGSVFQDSIQSFKTNGDDSNASHENSEKEAVDMETEGRLVGKTKIFHQDAYCDLCDREFCNKYFLKTHKANIHGVYSDEGSNSPKPLSVPPTVPSADAMKYPMPLTMPPILPASQPQQKSDTHVSLPNGNHSNQIQRRSPTSDITRLLQASKAMQQATSGVSMVPHPTRPMPATPPKNFSTLGGKSSGKSGHDMEDYCEICQKHFCNKYYLKKHKQDVHGIVPEPSPASSGKRGRPPMSAQLGPAGQHPPISMPSSLSASLANSLIMPPIMSSAAPGNGGPHSAPGGIPGLGNVMLINPFAPPMLLQGLPGGGQLPPGFPPGAIPQLAPTTPTSQASSSESPKAGSATTPSDSANVLNAEAYCEICRKEFCNKYFLRVHKATKHGIFLDEDMMPTTGPQSGLPVLNVPAPGAEMSRDLPPGTINITPKEPDNMSTKAKDEDSNEPQKLVKESTDSNNEIATEACHLCKKQFVNKYNLKVHMINAHNQTIPDFDLSPPRDNKTRSDKQPMQSTMFGNMIAAKLADRVMCDICNKEVCNKYFLKTHKIKVHGVDPAKVEAEAMNSSPQKKMQMNAMGFPPIPGMMMLGMPQDGKMGQKDVKPGSEAAMLNGDPNSVRPKDEDLLKMGIDPEAYCEICKKEFCSKYFLKTHKQNIHGIKMDSSTPLPGGMINPMGFPKLDLGNPEGANGLNMMRPEFAMAMAMNRGPGAGEPMFPLNLMNNNSKPSTTSASGNTSPASQADSEASGPWKWRESPNAASQRQVCGLCNKELCNKLFLRQHLLQKHGLMWDMNGPQSSATPMMPYPGLPGLPAQFINADMPLHLMPPFMTPGGRLPDGDMSHQPLDLKKSPSSGGEDSKETGWHLPFARAAKMATNQDGDGIECEICNTCFGDKVTLQLHMIQDHPGEVIVSARGKSSDKASRFSGANIGLNLRKKYQKSRRMRAGRLGGRVLGGTTPSSLTNGVKTVSAAKRKFRCAYCQDRFTSRTECQQHIRSTHPNAKSKSSKNKENRPTKGEGQKMDISASPLTNGVNQSMTMQSFVFEGQGIFAPARLELPVYEKIEKPVSVTFMLTPSLAQS